MLVWLSGAWTWSLNYDNLEPAPIPPLVHLAQSRTALIPRTVLRGLQDLLSVDESADALILRDAVMTPRFRWGLRKKLRADHRDTQVWAHRAMKQVLFYMSAAGYLPLVHSYQHGHPSFIFRAKAFEEKEGGSDKSWPHRLFVQPATVMPHLPFGPALFGGQANLDIVPAPDVVAFIVLESKFRLRRRKSLGPRLFFLDQLEKQLGPKAVDALRRREYKIGPDRTQGERNIYGHVEELNLFGVRQRTQARYMRFDLNDRTSVRPAANNPVDLAQALNDLKNSLDALKDHPCERLDLRPGDVLIVNNWRVATQWDKKCTKPYGSDPDVEAGDRVIFQMNFYWPKPITSHPDTAAAESHHATADARHVAASAAVELPDTGQGDAPLAAVADVPQDAEEEAPLRLKHRTAKG